MAIAWGTWTQAEVLTVDANYEFLKDSAGTDAIVLAPGAFDYIDFFFRVDVAGTPTDDVEIQIVGGHRVSTGNGLDGATGAADLELDTAADGFSVDDDMNGRHIIMTSGGEQGEGRLITDSVAADDGVNLSHALSGTPSATETYDLYDFAVAMALTIATATAAEDEPNTADAMIRGKPYVAVKVRADGATDSHRVFMSYRLGTVT